MLGDGLIKLKDDTFAQTIAPLLRHLIDYICKQCDGKCARNYTQQQLNDLQNELKRIRCMINYYILNESMLYRTTLSKADDLIDMKMLTHKSSSFRKEDYQRFEDLVEKFKSKMFLLGSNFITEKSLSIVDTLKMESDHWFVCRNDHVYNIDQVRETDIFLY